MRRGPHHIRGGIRGYPGGTRLASGTASTTAGAVRFEVELEPTSRDGSAENLVEDGRTSRPKRVLLAPLAAAPHLRSERTGEQDMMQRLQGLPAARTAARRMLCTN
eukprot:5045706-Prymnesium_polylepis.1